MNPVILKPTYLGVHDGETLFSCGFANFWMAMTYERIRTKNRQVDVHY